MDVNPLSLNPKKMCNWSFAMHDKTEPDNLIIYIFCLVCRHTWNAPFVFKNEVMTLNTQANKPICEKEIIKKIKDLPSTTCWLLSYKNELIILMKPHFLSILAHQMIEYSNFTTSTRPSDSYFRCFRQPLSTSNKLCQNNLNFKIRSLFHGWHFRNTGAKKLTYDPTSTWCHSEPFSSCAYSLTRYATMQLKWKQPCRCEKYYKILKFGWFFFAWQTERSEGDTRALYKHSAIKQHDNFCLRIIYLINV